MKGQLSNILTLFIILTLSVGCKTLKNLSPAEYSIDKISKADFHKLSGTYNNRQDTVFGQIVHMPNRGINENNRSLLDRLFLFFPDKADGKETTVEIKFISNKKSVVTAYQNGTVFLTKNIRGKFKDDYFHLRPKIFIIPFFPVFYWHNFEKIRIGDSGNDLVVDHTLKSWGFALFAGGSDNGLSTSIYKKTSK